MKHRFVRVGLLTALFAVVIAGCGGAPAGSSEEPAPAAATPTVSTEDTAPVLELPDEVTPDTVADLNAQGKIVVIDVREDWEFAEGHITGATLIPLGSLPDRVNEIPTDKPVVLVCRSGNRSGQAFDYLVGKGLDNVHNMAGGMNAWSGAGLPIEK